MDNELKQYLEAMESRLEGKMEAMENRFEGKLDAVEQRMKDHVSESVTNMETKILTEFHKWASVSDSRTRQAVLNINNFSERLLIMEDRISALERQRGGTQ